MSLHKQHKQAFLDQKLIPYRYSSRCCCSSGWGNTLQKSLRLHCFKLDRNNLAELSSHKYASIDWVGVLTWRHTIKTLAMTSFHEKAQGSFISNRISLKLSFIVLTMTYPAAHFCTCSSICQLPSVHVTSLTRCMHNSSWSTVHSYFLLWCRFQYISLTGGRYINS